MCFFWGWNQIVAPRLMHLLISQWLKVDVRDHFFLFFFLNNDITKNKFSIWYLVFSQRLKQWKKHKPPLHNTTWKASIFDLKLTSAFNTYFRVESCLFLSPSLSKGQLISEWLFKFSKKPTQKIWWISSLESKNWLNQKSKGHFYTYCVK